MAIPNPNEVAIVKTDALAWPNWTTVMVQHRWMEAFPVFEFSAIEPATEPRTAAEIQFRVGQRVTITLGGILAITGVITVRQSAEDPERHALQLIGKGYSWQMAKSSIVRPYDFSGQGIEQVAKTIAAETGVGVKTVGTVDGSPFPSLSVSPGEPAFDFLEHCARLRSTVLGSDEFGNILLIGQNTPGQGADFAIGKNIKRINVIISNETVFANYWATGQMQGSDQINGQAAAQMLAGPIPGSDAVVSNLVAPSEIPGNPGDLQKRAAFEAQIHDATQIRITVLVYGWLQPSGDLWRVGQSYRVFAPEHLPDEWNGTQFSAQTITFQQDDENGTTTTLELVLPWLLNGNLFQTGLPSLPSPSDTVRFGDNFTMDQ